MKLREFGLLADENVDIEVVQWLQSAGFDVVKVSDIGLQGAADSELLLQAVRQNRLILSHDADFGTLAVLQGKSIIGLLLLRPGHVDPQFTIGTLAAILNLDPDVLPPFILVARRTGGRINIRLRGVVL